MIGLEFLIRKDGVSQNVFLHRQSGTIGVCATGVHDYFNYIYLELFLHTCIMFLVTEH